MSKLASDLLFERDGEVAILSLNRPERLNAVAPGFNERLLQASDQIRSDPSIRAVVLTGKGRAFCAGADVQALGSGGYGEATADNFPIDEAGHWPVGWFGMNIPKPVVCAINGAAVGYGAELLATCDMRVAAKSARIGWVFSRLGIVTDMGVGPVLLPRLVGASQAARLLFSGEIIDANEALRIGLVDEVVPNAGLLSRAIELARHLASGAPQSIAIHKRQLSDTMLKGPHDIYFENLADFKQTTASEAFKEGVRAFAEKRVPNWGQLPS
jgi:2-(1,2-epoxy-1,2-dihydrophenyl)acetyl-CoA isomerase